MFVVELKYRCASHTFSRLTSPYSGKKNGMNWIGAWSAPTVENGDRTMSAMTLAGRPNAVLAITSGPNAAIRTKTSSNSSTSPCLSTVADESIRTMRNTCVGNERESMLISSGRALPLTISTRRKLLSALRNKAGSSYIHMDLMRTPHSTRITEPNA